MTACVMSQGYELAPGLKESLQSMQGCVRKESWNNCLPTEKEVISSSSSSDISFESVFSEATPLKEMLSSSSLLSAHTEHDDCNSVLSFFGDILSESDDSLGSFPSIISCFGDVEQETSDITMRDSISFQTDFGCGIEAIDRSPGISSANLYCNATEFSPEKILSADLPTIGEEWSCVADLPARLDNMDVLTGAPHELLGLASMSRLPDLVSPLGPANSTNCMLPFHGIQKSHAAHCQTMVCDNYLGNTSDLKSDVVRSRAQDSQEENGLQIVHLLLACTEAMDSRNYDNVRTILGCLRRKSSRVGDPMERLGVYFAEALDERLKAEAFSKTFGKKHAEMSSYADVGATDSARQAFYQHLPFLKYVHLTENQAIFDALREEKRIHVVDLDIRQGVQWASFIQSLSVRSEPIVSFRLTAMGSDYDYLKKTGHRLSQFAQELHVPFEFIAISATLEDMDSTMFNVDGDEAVAVSCSFVFHRLLQNKLSLAKALTTIRNLQPKIVSVLETEVNHNATFVYRFVEGLHFFSAIFDALDTTLERTHSERLLIENSYIAREIRNLIALDGFNGFVKHPQPETWSSYLRLAGLRELPLSSSAIYQAQLFIDSQYNSSYRLCQNGFALSLGWHETPIMSVSTWTY